MSLNLSAMQMHAMLGIAFLLSGCATYGVISNTPQSLSAVAPTYAINTLASRHPPGETALILAFSGGGTRAAALAYGVLEELRDTTIMQHGKPQRLLDEIDAISSVSGGSFTSAYYGLYGDRIFDDFEHRFLKRDVDSQLIRGLFNPLRWFSASGRTEMAVSFYDKSLFHGATFADLQRRNGPLIIINASDLSHGLRFSFVQEQFDLLCSSIATFPVSRAVTASSAVPLLFNPVVLENYSDCSKRPPATGESAVVPGMSPAAPGVDSYADKDKRPYIHLVDGGVTDNLGLRAIDELIEGGSGAAALLKRDDGTPLRRVAIISVDASTSPDYRMDLSSKQPSIEKMVGAVARIQRQHYNAETLALLQRVTGQWAAALSMPEQAVESYFITLNFSAIKEPEKREFFNHIPTRFSLSAAEVDQLIAAGRELLRNNAIYQQLIAELQSASAM